MNKYYLTAKSLMWTNSLILRFGFLFGFAISCLALWAGSVSVFVMLACFCSLGIAQSAYVASRSERRILVPGQNETAALVCVLTTIGMWLVIALSSLVVSGWELAWPGLSLLAISFCLWFGWGETLIIKFIGVFSLIITLTSIWLNFASQHQLEWVNQFLTESISDRWRWERDILGILIGLAGSFGLVRFWKLATTKTELASERRLDDLLTSKISPAVTDEADPQQPHPKRDFSSTGTLSRLQEITSGKIRLRKWELVAAVIAFSVLAGFLFGSRNDRSARLTVQLFTSLIILPIPSSFFLTRVPPKFTRLWLMGISNSRAQTGRWLAWIVLGMSLKWFIAFAVLALIQNGFGVAATSKSMIMPTISFGISGILMMIAAWGYRFFQRHADQTLLVGSLVSFVLAMLVIVIIATDSHSHINLNPTNRLGWANLPEPMVHLLISAVFAIVCWSVCIYAAGIGLARSARLLE